MIRIDEVPQGPMRHAPRCLMMRPATLARDEVGEFESYDYLVVNDEIGPAVERLRAIVLAEQVRMALMRPKARRIVSTFQPGAGASPARPSGAS